jgi:hypothetical protein
LPRGDCSPSSGEPAGGDHHAAGRIAKDREDVEREGAAKAEAGLDRGADDHELGTVVFGDLRQLAAEGAFARADHDPLGGDPVRLGERRSVVERGVEGADLRVEMRRERQLLRHDERRHQDDARTAVGSEPTGEVERVLRLGAAEQRDHDVPVPDGHGAAGETPCATADGRKVGPAHQMSW